MKQTPDRSIDRWRSGEPATAAKLNQTVDTLNGMLAIAPPRQVRRKRGGGGGSRPGRFWVMSLEQDYLICRAWDGTTDQDGEPILGQEDIPVALPFLLSRSPFDYDEESEDDPIVRDGYTYVYGSHDRRLAISADTKEVHVEVITPRYVEGDEILASRDVIGGTGISVNGKEVEWIDDNRDGRSWRPEKPGVLSVRVATTENHSLSGLSYVDDHSISEGDLVLVWKQNSAANNGIYAAANQAWTPVQYFDVSFRHRIIAVAAGSTYGRVFFICTNSDQVEVMGACYL